jgi:pimeloyl-ACP methyl ester carboxylesterase
VEVDEVAQLVPNLPPVAPARDISPAPTTRTIGNGRISYQIQLPPEYSHNRPYPVLIVLHHSGEKASAMLERWSAGAAENGYILVAPEWEPALGSGYNYTEMEQATVLKTLQDLRRCYRIDSDRVFLFGLGEGGKMAFDVGLSHPSLFAGVMPMGAAPFYFPGRCWRNAQYLPLYVVNGSLAGESTTQLRQIFTFWALRAYPALWVAYKGRGQEWYGGEVPNLFDWMRRQSRALPLHELGTDGLGGSFGNEFTILRPAGNRFYWLDATEINPRNTVSMARWNNLVPPATLTARTDPDTNEMVIKTSGILKLSVLMVRTARGQYNIDPDKPLTIRVGFRAVVVNRKVSASLEVLLEDLHQRGDRQQLVVGRVDVNPR